MAHSDLPQHCSYSNCCQFLQSAEDPYPTKDCLALPLYFTADRQRLVTRINVPCVGKPEKWVQCGAALFLKQM